MLRSRFTTHEREHLRRWWSSLLSFSWQVHQLCQGLFLGLCERVYGPYSRVSRPSGGSRGRCRVRSWWVILCEGPWSTLSELVIVCL